jgi:hypothetical protein
MDVMGTLLRRLLTTLYITRITLFQGGKRMYKAAIIPTYYGSRYCTIAENTQMTEGRVSNIETPMSRDVLN